MNTSKDRILAFKENMFPFGMLCELVGGNPNTVRTWLKRYFQKLGVKNKNGRMLFSGFDCVALKVFADLVANLAMQPEIAALVARAGISQLKKLVDTGGITSFEPIYFIITRAKKEGVFCAIIKKSEFDQNFEYTRPDPFLIVPFDFSPLAIQVRAFSTIEKHNTGWNEFNRQIEERKRDQIKYSEKIKSLEEENEVLRNEALSKHKAAIEKWRLKDLKSR